MPNVAIASGLKSASEKCSLLYVGSKNPLDAELVKSVNIPFKSVHAGKLRRYFSWENFVDPFWIFVGFFESLWIIVRFWPRVVFAKGGYVSIPVVLAAFVLRRKIILHESDSRMGLANKVCALFADKILSSFPSTTKNKKKHKLVGNPIRSEVLKGSQERGYKLTGFKKDLPVILVWGGSQGALAINQMVQSHFEKLKAKHQIVHITGKGKQVCIKDHHYISFEYVELTALKHLYSIADVVIGRAGANSLFELAAVQIPNIIIPLSNADQIGNAKYFEDLGAGIILQKEADLLKVLESLIYDKTKRSVMKAALKKISNMDACKKIISIILKI